MCSSRAKALYRSNSSLSRKTISKGPPPESKDVGRFPPSNQTTPQPPGSPPSIPDATRHLCWPLEHCLWEGREAADISQDGAGCLWAAGAMPGDVEPTSVFGFELDDIQRARDR